MGQEQSSTGGVVHAVVGSGAAVDAAARKALEEDQALIDEVNALPLPPPATTATGKSEKAGESDAPGGNKEESGKDNGTKEDTLTLVSALGALATDTGAISISGPKEDKDKEDGSVSRHAAGQQEVIALIDAVQRKALHLQGKVDSAKGYSKAFGRLADSVDQLAMHADENIDDIKAAVHKVDALGGKYFEKEHELHSFKNFVKANPIDTPKRASGS